IQRNRKKVKNIRKKGTGSLKNHAGKSDNQNHQLSWWYALRLEGDSTGGPTRALNGLPVAFPSRAAAKAAREFILLL
ncbi:MAG: hypothetical protein J6W70_00280, partial [Lentisphaeria bacterium]|nr:hypothetical protein [Lentisphaeria bacterium]